MNVIEISGHPIYYRTGGQGPPLLLLHGWGGSSRYWDGTLERLGDLRTIYAPDLPGYGESPPLKGVATPARMADVMLEFANALDLEYFDLNGHSFSSGVSVRIAAAHPARVRSLTLTCPSTYRNEMERRFVGYIHHVTALWMAMRRPWMYGKRVLYRTVARPFFYRVPTNDQLLSESFGDFLKMDQPTALESAVNAVSPDYNDMLRQVVAPTLVIGARHDTLMPAYGPPLVARLIPNGRVVWVERSGHLPMVERPEVYHRLLREFLTDENQRDFWIPC